MKYLILFWVFFKIGAFTFGGGYAMLPLVQEEVLAHGWLTLEEIVNFIAVSESTPGPFAVNMSTYVGQETAGILGAFCATFGVVLPSFGIVLAVARCFDRFQASPVVKGCMSGLKPAVVGLIGAALFTTGSSVFFPEGISLENVLRFSFGASVVIFVVALVLAFRKAHPILVIVLSGMLGILAGYAADGLAF